MLKDAALLHLDLLSQALEEGMIIKDSSAYNVQFIGAKPTFIDIPSFEKIEPGEPWVGYLQFCQMFLYPLMLQAYKGISFHALMRGNIDGISAHDMNKIFGFWGRFKKGVLLHIYLQAKAQERMSSTKRELRTELKSSGFNLELIKINVNGLKKLVTSLTNPDANSTWGDYSTNNSYTEADAEKKKNFIEGALKRAPTAIKLLWDVGCNRGVYSRLASHYAKTVVGFDLDHLAIDRFFGDLKKEGEPKNILPLVVNLTDPSPSLGWRNKERHAFTERKKPEFVICLALIHHAVISGNIPMEDFLSWLQNLTPYMVLEFVDRGDAMVKQLLLNKEDQYYDYHREYFEARLGERFEILDRLDLDSGTRTLYYLKSHNSKT
jgi:hypothetical protein